MLDAGPQDSHINKAFCVYFHSVLPFDLSNYYTHIYLVLKKNHVYHKAAFLQEMPQLLSFSGIN